MRQAIGTTWIMQLVIIFMLIFVAFLALSINYTKAFRIKNELITIIEKYEGAKEGEGSSVALINNYLRYNSYSVMRSCESGEYGASSLDTPTLEEVNDANSKKKFYYCIARVNTNNSKLKNRSKYSVKIFFVL